MSRVEGPSETHAHVYEAFPSYHLARRTYGTSNVDVPHVGLGISQSSASIHEPLTLSAHLVPHPRRAVELAPTKCTEPLLDRAHQRRRDR